ncbi:MAG: hypothetical protein U1E14_19075 [Geminicoccaceae bacterium]
MGGRRWPVGRCLVAAVAAAVLAGCSSIGPASVPRDRVDYVNALSDSWKDQILLNIVRLRYGDTPTFLDVSSVISAYTLQGAAQAAGAVNLGVPRDTAITPNASAMLGATAGYNDRPTISYTPLTGRKFAQSLLQPIPPGAIFALISAGYPVDVVVPVTVRALNGVYNHATQGGIRRSADPAFRELVDAWRRIQQSRSFSMRIERRGDEQVSIGVFAADLEPAVRKDIDFVARTLKLQAQDGEIQLVYGALPRRPDELAVLSRSMLEVLNELATDIEVPQAHVAAGRTYATAALPADADAYDLPQVRIRTGATAPPDAFAAVPYRGSWYWIDDGDLRSKRSLTFLLLFFSLAETGAVPEAPVLTIPVQ